MAKPARRFQYVSRDSETVKARSNARGGDFDSLWKEGIKIFKPREGKNTIRILPPGWQNARHYGFDVYINYGIGIEDQAYFSLSAMKNERDPIAEGRKEAEKDGDKKLADSLKPSHRVAFFVIDRMAEEEGPQLWPSPWTVDKAFCGLAIDEDTRAVIEVDNPDEGNDIRFYKEGTGMMTKYPAEKMRILKSSPLTEDEGLYNEWLSFVMEHPIPEMLNFYDYDHIASVFDGHVAKNSDEAPQRVKPAAARKIPDEEEDERPNPKAKPKLAQNEEMDEDTGEITTKKTNGSKTQKTMAADEAENEEKEAVSSMSVESIRQRLAGRRARPAVDDED